MGISKVISVGHRVFSYSENKNKNKSSDDTIHINACYSNLGIVKMGYCYRLNVSGKKND